MHTRLMASRTRSSSVDRVKDSTVVALSRVLEPLFSLIFDAGMTVREFDKVARTCAVEIATQKVIKETGRLNKSRIALITGLSRSDVATALDCEGPMRKRKVHANPARRVLAAWHDLPQYLDSRGCPDVLPIFGKNRSFERLVERFGGGIPVRAMLDELTMMKAIDRLEDQKVKANTRLPVLSGMSSSSIEALGERASDLLGTLLYNVRQESQPLFEATAVTENADTKKIKLVRREIAQQAKSFITTANSLLRRSAEVGGTSHKPPSECRIGVSVFYFQHPAPAANIIARRKNLRRQKRRVKLKSKTTSHVSR